MKTVLVTGDTGLVGSHVISALKKRATVIGLSRRHKESQDYETINFDLAKDGPLHISNVDAIFHLAADTACDDAKSAFATNVRGTQKMLELAKTNHVESFVYASTGGIYGFGKKPFKESDKPKPSNTYTKTKYSAELLCKHYSRHMPVVVLRYFYPYGPTERNRLINRLVNKIRHGDTIELNTAGAPVINPIAVHDAAMATIKSAKPLSNYNVFNIGGMEKVSILQLVRIIERQMGKEAILKYNNLKIGNMVGDITKAEKAIKFKPRIPLQRGIKEIIEKQN